MATLGACGSSGGSKSTSNSTAPAATSGGPTITPTAKWPATIPIAVVADLTGSAGGTSSQQLVDGLKLGVNKVNSELKGTKISLNIQDDASTTAQSVQLTTSAVAGNAFAIVGPSLSSGAVADAPIAVKGGVAYLGQQFSPTGVITAGPSTFDAVPATAPLEYLLGEYIQKLGGVKRVAIVYDSDVPTTVGLNQTVTQFGPKYGFTVVKSVPVTLKQVDYTSVASQLAGDNLDEIGIFGVQSQNATVAQQLIRAGYKGKMFSDISACCGTLTPLASAANGMAWVSDFTTGMSGSAPAAFVQQWQAAYGSPPIGASGAEAYDLMLFLGQGIKDAPTATRAGLIQGLTQAANQGFDGAEGHITFDNRSVAVAGVVVVWQDGHETLGLQGP